MKNITFHGLDDVLERFDGIDDDARIERALGKACALVERRARQLALKGRTGELSNTITYKVENLKGIVYSPMFYAPYVEYGTGAFREENPQPGYWVYVPEENGGGKVKAKSSRRYSLEEAKWIVSRMKEDGIEAVYTNGEKPHPFMRPALDENREEIKRILKEAILSD